MKICFVSLSAYPLFNRHCKESFGGAEVQLYNLAGALSKYHDISFIVADFGQERVEYYDQIKIIRSTYLGRKFNFFEKIKSVFIQFHALYQSDADIFFQRAAGSETGIVALYKFFFRKKFIYMTAHEIDCSGEYIKNNGINGILYKFGLKLADKVITQNYEQKKLLTQNYRIESIVIRSAYKIPNYHPRGNYILWVARLDKWKQPEIFLDLAESFSNEKFVMIAPLASDKEYGLTISDRARGVSNVEFISGVPFFEIDKYFSNAKIFVNTSKYEGFPNTFVQASMHGVPIISLNVNPDRILNEYSIGFFALNNPDRLKNDLELLLNNHEQYYKYSENAYNYAKEKHSIDAIVLNILNILNSLI